MPKPRPLAPPQDFLEVTGTKVAVHDSKFDVPDREDFPATRYTGQTLKPDFRDRLADDKAAQTAVRTAMLRRPNFAGQYSLVDIKCSKNCSPFIVADHKSGVLIDLPGSNKQGDVRVDYRRDSRLLAVQSVDHQSKNCVLQYFTIDEDANGKSKWTSVKDITIGKPELCKHSIEKNLSE